MSGWKTKKLGDLCSIELGRTPSRGNARYWDDKRETSNVWLSISDLLKAEDGVVFDSKEYVSDDGAKLCKTVPKGTLLVSFKLTLGRLAFAGRDLFTNEAIAALTIFNERELSKEFLFWALHSFDWNKAAENDVKLKGMTLNKAKLKEIPVSFPFLPEQQRIVGILAEAFAGIATAKANADKNVCNARSILDPAFGEVVTSVTAGKAPTETVERLAKPIKGSIRTGPFGSQLLHGEFVDSGVAVLGIDNAVQNKFAWNERRYITPAKFESLKRYKVYPGDVIITIMGTCGRCAVIPDEIPLAINSKHLCCITLDQAKCLPSFLHAYFLHHPAARDFLSARATGSVMDGLNMGIIKEIPVRLPSISQQREIMRAFESLRTGAERLESLYQQKLTALDELKKSLLHQAFSGHVSSRIEEGLTV